MGSFLASETGGLFGSSHGELSDLLPYAARLALECIGNSDALYHNVEHTMLVTLAGHDILIGRRFCDRQRRTTTPISFLRALFTISAMFAELSKATRTIASLQTSMAVQSVCREAHLMPR